jgi:hypothetical protein
MAGRRLQAAQARLREHPDPAWWQALLDRVTDSPFLMGHGRGGWRATIDWLLRPDSVTRILEGAYDDHARSASQGYPTVDEVWRQMNLDIEERSHGH